MRPKVKDRVEVRSLESLTGKAKGNNALLNSVLHRWEPRSLSHRIHALAEFVRLLPILRTKRHVRPPFPIPRPFPVFKHGVTMREHQVPCVNHYAVLSRRLAEIVIGEHAFVLGVEDVALLFIPRTGEN